MPEEKNLKYDKLDMLQTSVDAWAWELATDIGILKKIEERNTKLLLVNAFLNIGTMLMIVLSK